MMKCSYCGNLEVFGSNCPTCGAPSYEEGSIISYDPELLREKLKKSNPYTGTILGLVFVTCFVLFFVWAAVDAGDSVLISIFSLIGALVCIPLIARLETIRQRRVLV